MKIRPSLSGIVAVVPLAGFLWLMLYAYLASLQVGHWPFSGNPDPKSVGSSITGYAAMGLLIAFMCASPIAFAAVIWDGARRTLRGEWTPFLRRLSVFAVGAVLFTTQLLRLSDWLID